MPGAGKSTAGRQLAKRTGHRFVDCDAVIEAQIGESIRSFFEREGESPFRDIETAVVDELSHLGSTVIATGGGVVLRAENRAMLRERCDVVYLRSTPEELYRRLRRDTQRPLLQVADPLARLRELHEQRDSLYRETAHIIIDIGRPAVHALVNAVLAQLQHAGSFVVPGGEGDAPSSTR
jgi:shikimate kinase